MNIKKKEKKSSAIESNNLKLSDNSGYLKNVMKQFQCSETKQKAPAVPMRQSTTVAKESEKKTEKLPIAKTSTVQTTPADEKDKVFKLNEQLEGENLTREFKNFNCTDILPEQYKILTKVICAFLNTEGGKLYLGVDNSGRVIGRQFSKEGKQKFENKLLKLLSAFAPVPAEKTIKLKFHRIIDPSTHQLLENKFLVIIKTKKGPIDELFMDQDGKSYYRLDGQTQKYSPEEYHEELLLRATMKESLEEHQQNEEYRKKMADAEIAALNEFLDNGKCYDAEVQRSPQRSYPAQDEEEEDEDDVVDVNALERQIYERSRGKKQEEENSAWNSESYRQEQGWNPEMYGQEQPPWNPNSSMNSTNYYGGYMNPANSYPNEQAFPTQQFYNYSQQMYAPPQQQPQQQQQQQQQYSYAPQYNYDNNQYYNQSYGYQPQYQSAPVYQDKELEESVRMINQVYEQQARERASKK